MHPSAAPSDISKLRDAFVRPFYLRLLHGNFIHRHEAEGGDVSQAIVEAARTITDEEIEVLLGEREWRGRLCAAWFIGLSGRARFVPEIGKLLLASEMVYAGEGYCMALGLIGGDECAYHLRSYLKTYLPLNGRVYNQEWAIGALAYIEGAPPIDYLEQELWRDGEYTMDPAKGVQNFGRIIAYVREHQMIEGHHG